ncbi:MAG: hypothetical protein H0W42_12475 [Gemmatimonadaceae bacterium]|nr:hypothetical protein [Gemmatimonadaceae bacterium]
MGISAGDQPFSIRDAAVYPFSAGVPGTGVLVAYPVSIESDPQSTDVEHRGGNSVISKFATRDSIDLDFVIATHTQAQIVAIAGGTLAAETGTTPNITRTLTMKSTDSPPQFGLSVQTDSKSADGGALRLSWPRCTSLAIPDFGFVDGEYKDLTFPCSAIPNATDEMVKVTWRETYAALTTTFTP